MSIRSRPKTLHPKNPGYLTRSDPSRKMDKRLKALRKKVKHQREHNLDNIKDWATMESQLGVNRLYDQFDKAADAGNLEKAEQIHQTLQNKIQAHRETPKAARAARELKVRKRGGTVSRRGGGKIMVGYKAGGKV
tara:strand:+ start:213 stop:617 length:405 start_codon:yes stop_codon:yes gene_type:complete